MTLTRLLRLYLALVLLLPAPSAAVRPLPLPAARAPAAPTVITFEEFPAGPDVIRFQYLGTHGVTFRQSRVISPALADAPGQPVDQALETYTFNNEFDPDPLVIEFTSGQSYVKLDAGLNRATTAPVTAVLRAYDAGGLPIGSPVSASIGPGPTPITAALQVTSAAANIRRVELNYETSPGLFFEVIDNLEFDSVVAPPPDNDPPVVTINTPIDGSALGTPYFLLQGAIQDASHLADVRLAISQHGKAPVVYQIPHSGTPASFTFGSGAWLGLLFEGENTLTVTATDIHNNTGQDSVTVTYTPPAPEPPPALDLFPVALEVTQGIQDQLIELISPPTAQPMYYNSNVPLVAGRPTVARLYATAQGAGGPVPGVVAELTGIRFSDGSILPGSPLRATPQAITVNPAHDIHTQRADLALTWNFVLPPEWVQAGKINLRAEVNPGQALPECPGCYNFGNRLNVLHLNFKAAPTLHLYPFWACVRRSPSVPATTCDVVAPTAPLDLLFSRQSGFSQMFPVSAIDVHLAPNPILYIDGDFSDPSGYMSSPRVAALLAKVYLRRRFDGVAGYYACTGFVAAFSCFTAARNHVYLGLFPSPSGAADGLGMVGRAAAVTKFDLANLFGDSTTAAQEVGHAMGHGWHVPSTNCGKNPDAPHNGYPHYTDPFGNPYPRSSIGTWALDTRPPLEPASLKDPRTNFDYMSYCDPGWVSEFTYRAVDRLLEREFTLGHGGEAGQPALAPVARLTVQPYLLVTGDVLPDEQVLLDPAYHFSLPIGTDDGVGHGDHRLELVGAGGQVLFARYFAPGHAHGSDLGPSTHSFAELVPFPAGTALLRIRHGEHVLAQRPVSAHAPSVTVLAPNGGETWAGGLDVVRWEAQDADGDPLAYTVQYSADGGATWQTMAVNLAETQLTVDSGLVAGSPQARVRVLASDGVNTSFDDSDAVFNVTDKPPLAALLNPVAGDVFALGERVLLQAVATDPEDGPLADDRFQWSSDRDGALGTGRELEAAHLSPGVHTLRLTVEDSHGQATMQSVQIEVVPPALGLEIGPVAVTPVCSAGVSHLLQFEWQVTGGSGSALIESLTVSTSGLETKVVAGPFPAAGAIVLPVQFSGGGPARLVLAAVDETGPRAAATQTAALSHCLSSELTISRSPVVFETVPPGSAISQPLRLRNIGAEALEIGALSASGAPFSLAGLPPLPLALAPGQEVVFAVSFAPSAPGGFSGALTITTGDRSVSEFTVRLEGASLAPPAHLAYLPLVTR